MSEALGTPLRRSDPGDPDSGTRGAAIFIGLGSNLGDRLALLRAALERLDSEEDIRVLRVSPLYESRPWGFADQPDFLNAVAELRSDRPPRPLLALLKSIERALGRPAVDPIRYGPRPIDLDLLLYGDRVMRDLSTPLPIEIPHPHLAERAFVLLPLADLAPDLVHPTLGQPIAALCGGLDASGLHMVARDWFRQAPA